MMNKKCSSIRIIEISIILIVAVWMISILTHNLIHGQAVEVEAERMLEDLHALQIMAREHPYQGDKGSGKRSDPEITPPKWRVL